MKFKKGDRVRYKPGAADQFAWGRDRWIFTVLEVDYKRLQMVSENEIYGWAAFNELEYAANGLESIKRRHNL